VNHFCTEDASVPGIIVPTPALFLLHSSRERLGLDTARKLLLAPGVFEYTP
jgi:hypothetical protein